jgi:outer membrane biosynthesis protein TonB
MKKRATILMLTGLAVAAVAANPEADSTYFHPAASFFIQGNTAGASNLVARGLAEFPDDGKLKRLKELLENKQQQDQQKNDQQQDQEQQDQQQDQEQQDQNQNDPQQDPADQQDQQQQPEPQRAEQMSQDEAERLLDAMKQEEKNKRLELHPVMGRPVQVDKDW